MTVVVGLLLAVVVVGAYRRRRRHAALAAGLATVMPSLPGEALWTRDPFTGARDRLEF